MTPQQNGVAERVNQTLLERVRCMLSNAGLGRRYWSEAVMTACYIINRGPHSGIDFKIPFEIWSGKLPSFSNLKIFGCVAYYHVSEGKLDPRAKVGCFVGYGDGVKGFRIYSPSEGRVILSRDVTFDESTMYSKKSTESSDLGKGKDEILQSDGVLEVHQSSIADLPRVQFIDDDAEVPIPGTPEPEVGPSSPNSGVEVEQSDQGSSSQSDTVSHDSVVLPTNHDLVRPDRIGVRSPVGSPMGANRFPINLTEKRG